MKIGILHLTDIHLTRTTNFNTKVTHLNKIMLLDFHNIDKLYIILSGDIAFSGQKEEYGKAKAFVDNLKKGYAEMHPNIDVMPIIVPGNHDCNFSQSPGLRATILKNVNYESIGKDNSFIDLSISVQNYFWGFYGFYHKIPEDKMFYILKDIVCGKKISFICLNTAWMSQLKEDSGTLFYPVNRYRNSIEKDDKSTLKIATWHHPINWFTPSTQENNKQEFQNFIESIAPIHFIGHEHEHDHHLSINKQKDLNTHLLSGKLFHDDKKPNESGFQTAVIELKDHNTILKQYSWEEEHYKTTHTNEFSLAHETRKLFQIKKEFDKEINDTKIPLLFSRKDIRLLDIFIFPDIEPSASKNIDKLESYIDSEKLLETDFANCILDGDSQIGKSALLAAIFLKSYRDGFFPILVDGKDFKSIDLDKIVKRAFQKQYANAHNEFDKFMQIDSSKRILLIDDYHKTILNSQSTKSVLDEAGKKFGKVLITIESTYSLLPTMQSEFDSWKFYSIKPLGYKKRNDLIETFHYLKEDPITFNETSFLEYTKFSYDNVSNILGNKLMPSYPIFILSILQALEYKPMQHQETSFGYCYQTLIHYSLNNAGVSNELIDTYFNFLTELAYFNIEKDVEHITRKDYDEFYFNYQKDFIVPNFEVIHKTLLKSKVILEKDNCVAFGYKYILYYLSAKKISDVLHKTEGQNIIKKLFQEVHLERNANILVFVTHHSKDISFIEESRLNSMIVLDNVSPITLFKDDPFYNVIQELAEEVKHDVLEINRNPREERRKLLHIRDENQREVDAAERKIDDSNEDLEDVKSKFVPFQQSFRSIEIIGQIIRNRKGSLTKKQLHEMTKEIYTTGFRTISFVSELLNNDKNDIIATIVDDSDENESKSEITNRINILIQMMCLQTCLGVFNKLMFSVGNKDMKDLYQNVAEDINTPAARLVSFGINSYYGKISINELKEISAELKGNIVATNLLKARVKSYVYNRKVEYDTKQQIASVLNMSLGPVNKFDFRTKENAYAK